MDEWQPYQLRTQPVRRRRWPAPTLVEQLEIDRVNRESGTVRLLRDDLAYWQNTARMTAMEKRVLEREFEKGTVERIRDKIAIDLSRALRKSITEAVNKAAAAASMHRYFDQVVVPAELRFANIHAIEREVLDKYLHEYRPCYEVRGHPIAGRTLTAPSSDDVEDVPHIRFVLHVEMHALEYNHVIAYLTDPHQEKAK